MNFKPQLLVGLLLASSASAEDYYAPVKKELEPRARIPLPEFIMNDGVISYTLPRDLTGREIKLQLERDPSLGNEIPRIFRGNKATLACMGSNELPACVVTHKDLGLDNAEVSRFLRSKYRDPQKLKDAIDVALSFSAGNEPIGIISKRSVLPVKELPKVWSVEILMNRQGNQSLMTVANTELSLDAAQFVSAGAVWPLSAIGIDQLHIAADYMRAGRRHWMDLDVSTDKTSFEGTWGFFDAEGNPLRASGVLKGIAK